MNALVISHKSDAHADTQLSLLFWLSLFSSPEVVLLSLLLLAISVLSFSSLIPTVAASPIDDMTTCSSSTPATTFCQVTSVKLQ